MRFEKWQALGNDYLIVEQDELPFELTPARIRRCCEAHFGVGSDGVLLLARTDDPDSDYAAFLARLRIYNPDGSEAELSGNGVREAALYLSRRWTERRDFWIHTAAGAIHPEITGPDSCRVEMGQAFLASKDYPGGSHDGLGNLDAAGRAWRFQHVSIGNPQCAIHVEAVDQLQALDLPAIGPAIEGHALFPNRTNVSWYTQTEPNRICARIFERGVGETLSSGTGATGAAVAHHLRTSGAPGETIAVAMDGGELEVEVGEGLHTNLTGWAKPVFAGTLSEDFVRELNETQ
ncbi:MAG: diaminopimelate epimerase [Solirubrobacterales bacterium]